MAIISITIDTEEQTIVANINGKEVTDVNYASASCCEDYYKRGKKNIYWNVSCSNSTDDDDFNSSTNFCSAAEVLNHAKNDKFKADVLNYFDKKSGR